MAKAGYVIRTSAAVALVAATAKTSLMMITPSTFGGDLKKIKIGFDGVTATDKAVLIELVTSTNASNSTPGTGNTSETSNIVQVYGRSITTGFTGFSAATSEPTVLTVIDAFTLSPIGGTALYDIPLGDTYDWPVSAGMGVRLTAPTSAVNARISMLVERC